MFGSSKNILKLLGVVGIFLKSVITFTIFKIDRNILKFFENVATFLEKSWISSNNRGSSKIVKEPLF